MEASETVFFKPRRYWHERDKRWIVRVRVEGKDINIGRFQEESDAIKAGLDASDLYIKNEKQLDYLGKIFGRLKIIEIVEKNKNGDHKVFCNCICGNTKIAHIGNIRTGKTRSCGCLSDEKKVEFGKMAKNRAKLDMNDKAEIQKLHKDDYITPKEIARIYNVSKETIRRYLK